VCTTTAPRATGPRGRRGPGRGLRRGRREDPMVARRGEVPRPCRRPLPVPGVRRRVYLRRQGQRLRGRPVLGPAR
jgi:hypothetical protein